MTNHPLKKISETDTSETYEAKCPLSCGYKEREAVRAKERLEKHRAANRKGEDLLSIIDRLLQQAQEERNSR